MIAWTLLFVVAPMVAASTRGYCNLYNPRKCSPSDYYKYNTHFKLQPWTSYGYEPVASETSYGLNAQLSTSYGYDDSVKYEKKNWGGINNGKKCFPPRHPMCRGLLDEEIQCIHNSVNYCL
ncbi:hypothetical protein L596_030582 [Steinernema carpocapsae]|uniref:Secreted protein n=1 Tax=Steinernema carpocapsae TaxID=34508 RepID=A0A4U5LPU8_STECR|nr:hypothetical protein L596_030582 [Steinernema carpocapsae]